MSHSLPCAALAFWLCCPNALWAYVDIPPATLGRLCANTMSITLMRVEKVSHEKSVVLFRAVRDLKGNGPSDVIKLSLRGAPDKAALIVAWAEVGKTTLHFASASRNYSYTYIDGLWYACTYAQEWWHLTPVDPNLLRAYCGRCDQLSAAVTELLAGKEVVVPCMAADNAELLRKGAGRIQRLRASLKLLDYDAKRDFVGWGSADATLVRITNDELVLRQADKDEVRARAGVALLDADGKPLEGERLVQAFRPGTPVEITERHGKVVEVRARR